MTQVELGTYETASSQENENFEIVVVENEIDDLLRETMTQRC